MDLTVTQAQPDQPKMELGIKSGSISVSNVDVDGAQDTDISQVEPSIVNTMQEHPAIDKSYDKTVDGSSGRIMYVGYSPKMNPELFRKVEAMRARNFGRFGPKRA